MGKDTFDEKAAQAVADRLGVKVLIFGHIHQPAVVYGSKLLTCPGRGGTGAQPKKFSGISVAMIEMVERRITRVRIDIL